MFLVTTVFHTKFFSHSIFSEIRIEIFVLKNSRDCKTPQGLLLLVRIEVLSGENECHSFRIEFYHRLQFVFHHHLRRQSVYKSSLWVWVAFRSLRWNDLSIPEFIWPCVMINIKWESLPSESGTGKPFATLYHNYHLLEYLVVELHFFQISTWSDSINSSSAQSSFQV